MLGAADNSEDVADVEFTHQIHVELEAGNLKFGGRWAITNVESLDRVIGAQAKPFDRAMRDVEQRREIWIVAIGQQLTFSVVPAGQCPEGTPYANLSRVL